MRTIIVISAIFCLAAMGCALPSPPAAPGTISVAPGDGQLFVYWAPVSGATSYDLAYGTENDSSQALPFGGATDATHALITGLANDTAYYVWVKAVNSAGTSGFSAPGSGTPQAGANDNRVIAAGAEFFVDGERIWMNGCNTPWDNWNDFGGSYDHSFWNDHYTALHENGVNDSRVWITCSGEVGIIIDTNGHVSGATAAHWTDLDDFFATAESTGVRVMATLMSFDHFKDTYTKYQNWRNWINSDANIESYITNYLIPFCTRYGGYSSLWAIDLTNEPDWATNTEGGTIDWARFQQFWAKASKAIHENSRILVTVGIAVIKYNSDAAGNVENKVSDAALRAQLNDLKVHLDFYSPHYYPWMELWWEIPFYVTPAAYGMDTSKPCLIGENPATGSTGHTLTQDFESAFANGWQGVQPWTSNGVDGNGGFAELTPATNEFYTNHPTLVFPN
ncbi:MAG: fibronectin type III domain-containing protein [Spirochaetales bacterium]|nr:fibronectin type III domain-containing protein [Spirochaetales bacterium]